MQSILEALTANYAQIATGHLAVTCYLVGLIWTIQRVHYPSMAFNDPEPNRAIQAEKQHCDRIFWIVGPAMLIEGALATMLLVASLQTTRWLLPGLGMLLLLCIWLSTALIQMPIHDQLLLTPNRLAQERLVRTNWIRTVAWSLRGLLAVWLVLGF